MRHAVRGLSFVVFLVFFRGAAVAEVGFDFLGIRIDARWDCDAMLASIGSLPKKVPVGWLDDTTFGTSDVCLEKLLGSGRITTARAHLLNNTCVRGKNCWAGDKLNGYTLARVEQEALSPGSRLLGLVCDGAKRIESFAKRFSSVRFLVSGLLEHNMSRDAARAVAAEVARCAPSTQAGDNPATMGTLYPPFPEAVRETHGTTVNPVTSLDGVSVENADVERWKEKNIREQLTLLWGFPLNCRLAKGWVQPNLRESCATPDLFSLYARLWAPAPPIPSNTPSSCSTIQKLPNPWFYKSVSEDDGTGAPQANKPMLDSPLKTDRIDVLAADGTALGWFKYFGATPEGGARYYLGSGSGQTAFELGQSGEKQASSSWVAIASKGRCFWVNAYRSGPF